MKIIYNYLLPFPGYVAMMFFGADLARRKYRLKAGHSPIGYWDEPTPGCGLPGYVHNHECIHQAQAFDFKKDGERNNSRAYCRFYWAYLGQWLRFGYKNIPFEREARTYARWPEYLEHREPHAWKEFVR